MIDNIINMWNSLVDCILSIPILLVNFFYCIIEDCFNFVLILINGLGEAFSALNVTQYLSFIPSDIQNIMALLGVDVITSIIVTSIIIRFTLQLIPFTRLGS